MQSTNDLVAAFLAKGNAVKKIAEGDSCGMNRRDWYKAVRGEASPRVVRVEREDSSIRITTDHLGREWYSNAAGEVLGHE